MPQWSLPLFRPANKQTRREAAGQFGSSRGTCPCLRLGRYGAKRARKPEVKRGIVRKHRSSPPMSGCSPPRCAARKRPRARGTEKGQKPENLWHLCSLLQNEACLVHPETKKFSRFPVTSNLVAHTCNIIYRRK